MSRFYSLDVADVRQETRDAVSVAFAIPAELQDTFRFSQGQHLVLRTRINDEEVRRSYSICSGVHDGELRIAVKRVAGGLFSNWLNDQAQALLHSAQPLQLEAMPPAGHFSTELDAERVGHYLGVAAGSGITPILSIIKTTLDTEPQSTFTLFYANRSTSSTIFREQLADLKNRYMGRLNLVFLMTREQQDIDLYNGRLDHDKCKALFDRWLDVPHLTAAFLCGPQQMIELVSEALQQHDLDKARIHYELFGTGLPATTRRQRDSGEAIAAELCDVTVIADGRQINFGLARDTRSILDAGNEHGADLPYSCKAGVCSTCRAKVVEGEVEMDVNFALEDYEVKAGYVLSCQCFPVSKKVVLDFDTL
ncbi:phenylacetic acid degradation protein [Pokkaliibacter plantistimulans]|uniref:Phenylacetic acid degradation protein n=1 Tax=Pokkaliibacter plantistimulans TaxID=1635171 RepID=A0ABX5LYW8_9GAMM|nr:1,2-phenylacetyl-CoA epoxidase subunit PaaE [Pokkaliibacter plantistimulans]PXF31412.1 phenylacetic acid degradation protein [Pokkaliibacter plantistimulans]